jgi:hypothetical protein
MTKSQDEGFKKTLQRMLKTPPKPHEPSGKKKKSPETKDKKKPGK